MPLPLHFPSKREVDLYLDSFFGGSEGGPPFGHGTNNGGGWNFIRGGFTPVLRVEMSVFFLTAVVSPLFSTLQYGWTVSDKDDQPDAYLPKPWGRHPAIRSFLVYASLRHLSPLLPPSPSVRPPLPPVVPLCPSLFGLLARSGRVPPRPGACLASFSKTTFLRFVFVRLYPY